jgi:sporulation protein YlmC with PRC-barrel domain
VSLPEQLLLSDLLRRRVRCDQGIDHGASVLAWMHPPVHRLLGWISKPSAFGDRRKVWRLDQLRGLGELEALVQGPGADTDLPTVDRLPSLIDAAVLDRRGDVIGSVADAAVELSTGQILHYLVSRSDPRLPGSSRWRLSPERISDQQSGQVFTGLSGLDDLPLARASVRQEFLRRGRRWRDQFQEETERLRDQFQQAGDRFEERLEGWIEEEPVWESEQRPEPPYGNTVDERRSSEAWDDWDDKPDSADGEQWPPQSSRTRQHREDEDPWL